jgi:hypothetical protein
MIPQGPLFKCIAVDKESPHPGQKPAGVKRELKDNDSFLKPSAPRLLEGLAKEGISIGASIMKGAGSKDMSASWSLERVGSSIHDSHSESSKL